MEVIQRVIFDSNIYIGINPEKIGEIKQLEQQKGIKPSLSSFVLFELVAGYNNNRADTSKEKKRRAALGKMIDHTEYFDENGKGKFPVIPGGESLLQDKLLKRKICTTDKDIFYSENINTLIYLAEEIVSGRADQNIEKLNKISNNWNSMEDMYKKYFKKLLQIHIDSKIYESLSEPEKRKEFKNHFDGDNGLKNVCRFEISRHIALLTGEEKEVIDSENELVDYVFNHFKLPMEYLRREIQRMFNNPDEIKPNDMGDFQISYVANTDYEVSHPILVTNDGGGNRQGILQIAQQAGNNRVKSLDEYLKYLQGDDS